jgi:predicted AlkP superfamily phosphohydrolase/phosphomutase
MYVNNWLAQQGYIQFKEDVRSRLRLLMHRTGIGIHSIYSLTKKLSLDKTIALLPQSWQEAGVKVSTLTFDDVDWSRTVAYSFGNFGRIFVNLRGREPMGCVLPGQEYEEMRERIILDLQQLRDLDGTRIVTGVWRREEIYHGAYLDQAPDLVFTLKDWEYGTAPNYEFASNQILSAPLDNISGNHRLDGMLIAWGSQIREKGLVSEMHITDVAPTILHLMDLPIPSDLDGQVLRSMFKATALSDEDERLISDRLEALGYF